MACRRYWSESDMLPYADAAIYPVFVQANLNGGTSPTVAQGPRCARPHFLTSSGRLHRPLPCCSMFNDSGRSLLC